MITGPPESRRKKSGHQRTQPEAAKGKKEWRGRGRVFLRKSHQHLERAPRGGGHRYFAELFQEQVGQVFETAANKV